MSTRVVPKWLLSHPDVPPGAKLLYLTLRWLDRVEGIDTPTLRDLSKLLGTKETTLKNFMRVLERTRCPCGKLPVLVIEPQAGGPNRYWTFRHDCAIEPRYLLRQRKSTREPAPVVSIADERARRAKGGDPA